MSFMWLLYGPSVKTSARTTDHKADGLYIKVKEDIEYTRPGIIIPTTGP